MFNFNKLKDIREDNDMSQKEVSKILGVNRSTYSLWELGINIIPLKYLFIFSNFFNTSIDYIFGLTKIKTKNYDTFDFKIISYNMKRIRLMHNLSQENVANILGVTQACINRYEKGLICISTISLYNFVKYFKISTNELLVNDELLKV